MSFPETPILRSVALLLLFLLPGSAQPVPPGLDSHGPSGCSLICGFTHLNSVTIEDWPKVYVNLIPRDPTSERTNPFCWAQQGPKCLMQAVQGEAEALDLRPVSSPASGTLIINYCCHLHSLWWRA